MENEPTLETTADEPQPIAQDGAQQIAETSAPAAEPQQTAPNAYDSIIEQQVQQINALIAQNQNLTNQITQLIQSGAQIGQPQQHAYMPQKSLADNEDYSLEALAKDIGRHGIHGER